MSQRILFVDDEKSILKSIERLFFDSEYEIFTAESGEEGLQVLADNQIDVVMSDMRMPGMDGHKFLKTVKSLYPHTTRLILSGYSDESQVFRSLIDGSCNLYMFKPWNSENLMKRMGQIFEIRKILNNTAVLEIANGLENLSFITGVYNSVCRLIDEEASVGTIAKVIETDPAVTAAVLRIVNSAFYNVKTGSINQAITFLGLPVVKSVVLTCSLSNAISIRVPPFNINKLTQHASTTNSFLAKIYYELHHKQLPDNIATAGLLHNLGLVLCLHYFPDKYQQIVAEREKQTQKSLMELEKEILGITHAELGGYLLNWWGIPFPTVECALFHHEPLHEGVINPEAVCAVHVAAHYAWETISPNIAVELETEAFSLLGIEKRDCERLLLNRA